MPEIQAWLAANSKTPSWQKTANTLNAIHPNNILRGYLLTEDGDHVLRSYDDQAWEVLNWMTYWVDRGYRVGMDIIRFEKPDGTVVYTEALEA